MKKLAILLLVFVFMVHPFDAFSQALPANPSNVNRALSGSLQSAMINRGFAANDPRFGNTLARISPALSGVAGTATAVTVAGVTAPGWASVALMIGIGAVVTYAVNLALDALTNWLFRSDNKIDESGTVALIDPSAGLVAGQPYWSVGDGVTILTGGDGFAIAEQAYYNIQKRGGNNNPASPTCKQVDPTHVLCSTLQAGLINSGSPKSCPKGSFYSGSACSPYSFTFPPYGSAPQKNGVGIDVATTDLPASDLDKRLNPTVIAGLANAAWKNAASQPGYDGLPYPQSNPVTSAEVSTWEQANPNYSPSVRDFTSPMSASPATNYSLPINPSAATTTPATTPNANTTNPASAQPLTNLGSDPGTPAPTLEQTPTARQIIQPLLDLFPDLKNYNPSMSVGSCPRPTLNLFGQTQTMEAHCTILENNRAVIHAAMVLAFSLLALLIVLSA